MHYEKNKLKKTAYSFKSSQPKWGNGGWFICLASSYSKPLGNVVMVLDLKNNNNNKEKKIKKYQAQSQRITSFYL